MIRAVTPLLPLPLSPEPTPHLNLHPNPSPNPHQVGVEKALRVTERQLKAIQDQGAAKQGRIDALNAELEATRSQCSRIEVTAEPQTHTHTQT